MGQAKRLEEARLKAGEIKTEEGYYLAPFFLRLAAAAIDAALFSVLAFVLFALFNWAIRLPEKMGVTAALDQETSIQVASGLANEDGSPISGTIEDYSKALEHYYLVYNAADSKDCPEPRGYTVTDYNVEILGLPRNPADPNRSEFYQFDGDDPTKVGVLKPEFRTVSDHPNVLAYLKDKYEVVSEALLSEPYYVALQKTVAHGYMVLEAICLFPSAVIFYLVVPVFDRKSRTLGKRFMNLAVVRVSGEALPWYFVALRPVLFLLTLLGIILFNEIWIAITVSIAVFLITLGSSIFTKKKRALHDFVSLAVVIRGEEAPEKENPFHV